MKNWITNNFVLKLIALGLAVVTWIYVNGEVIKRPPSSSHVK